MKKWIAPLMIISLCLFSGCASALTREQAGQKIIEKFHINVTEDGGDIASGDTAIVINGNVAGDAVEMTDYEMIGEYQEFLTNIGVVFDESLGERPRRILRQDAEMSIADLASYLGDDCECHLEENSDYFSGWQAVIRVIPAPEPDVVEANEVPEDELVVEETSEDEPVTEASKTVQQLLDELWFDIKTMGDELGEAYKRAEAAESKPTKTAEEQLRELQLQLEELNRQLGERHN